MRIDFRDKTIDSQPGDVGAFVGGKVIRRDTGEVLRQCFLADDQTGEWGCYKLKDGQPYIDPNDPNEPAMEFGKAPLMIIKAV